MLNIADLRALVIRPTLQALALYSPAAENLLVATHLQEAGTGELRQMGGGPALGIYQMEPATHDDCWANWLAYRKDLAAKIEAFLAPGPSRHEQLVWNLAYASALTRVRYARAAEPLPADPDDAAALGAYWKAHYNTPQGAGLAETCTAQYLKFGAGSAPR